MNPFLHPAVATPLDPEQSVFRPTQAFSPAGASPRGSGPCSSAKPGRRGNDEARGAMPRSRSQPRQSNRRWCRAAGSLALATALGMSGVAETRAQPASAVNANIASVTELQSIKGIGPKTAQTIVLERQRSGPFESFQDFAERIRGIGPRRAQALRAAGLTVSNAPRAAERGADGEGVRQWPVPEGGRPGSVGVVVR